MNIRTPVFEHIFDINHDEYKASIFDCDRKGNNIIPIIPNGEELEKIINFAKHEIINTNLKHFAVSSDRGHFVDIKLIT